MPSSLTRRLLYVHELFWEHRLRINTRRPIETSALGFDSREDHRYTPAEYFDLARIMRWLRIRGARETFLDYGCSMGRAVLFAARQPFRQVLGIDKSSHLIQLAEQNAERARPGLRCKDIVFQTHDAANYQVPDPVSVVFLYNPFHGETLRCVTAAIAASLRRSPRLLTVVLKNPGRAADWVSAGLSPCHSYRSWAGHDVVFYRTTPGILPP